MCNSRFPSQYFPPSFFAKFRAVQPVVALGIIVFCTTSFVGCETTKQKNSNDPRLTKIEKTLRTADHTYRTNPSQAMGLYLNAAQNAFALITDKSLSAPGRAEAERIYNTAVTDCAMTLQKLKPTSTDGHYWVFTAPDTTYRLRILSTGAGAENPSRFDHFVDASKINRKHLDSNTVRDGIGGSLVGVQDSARTKVPNRPPNGFAEPVTAVATFSKGAQGDTSVVLSFYDPRVRDKVTLNNTSFPLKGDFTAPLAYFPKTGALFGVLAMLNSDKVAERTGIYFIEPYNPNKIPVLFVHGLMSSPQTWVNFVNSLNNDPDFRKHYQAWVYFYPTGTPIAGSALRLRMALAEAAAHYPLKRNMIVVGHSMGGILTRMQVTNTKRLLWDGVFGKSADAFYKTFPSKGLLKRALIFEANPYVTRVVFFSTPHLGSDLATLRISEFGSRLVRLPSKMLNAYDSESQAAVKSVDPSLRTTPTSILALSPKSPLLKNMGKLPMTVPCHSVIGNRGKDQIPLAKSSDGVVCYWSSHVGAAKSELIVPTGHDSFNNPQSVKEVLRILKLK
ncbi:MAG: hypothetical protein ABI615_02625 [Chthoniobacterales bacterium]